MATATTPTSPKDWITVSADGKAASPTDITVSAAGSAAAVTGPVVNPTVAAGLKYAQKHFTQDPLSQFIAMVTEDYRQRGIKPPWVTHEMKLDLNGVTSKTFSMFPITNPNAWKYYCMQDVQMWSAKELRYGEDKKEFHTLKKRYQQLYYDLLGFFAPGDGLISMNVVRMMMECTTYCEQAFFMAQLFIETVHSEGYGMSITSIIPDVKEQERVFKMVDDLPCVKAKADFIKKYINSDLSRSHRYIAAACAEGIFFVTLFAIIFYMKDKGIMKTFSFMNEQISKDETVHRDFNCAQVIDLAERGECPMPPIADVHAIIKEAVNIEIDHVKYVLREAIDSPEADALAGITVAELSNYARTLGDQILVLIKTSPMYNVTCDSPFLRKIGLINKTNFYEGSVGTYMRLSLNAALNWEERAGFTKVLTTADIMSNPAAADF